MKWFLLFFFYGFFISTALYADAPEGWNLHGQSTVIAQVHPPFHAPYSGPNSLVNDTDEENTFTATLYAGMRLWRGGALYFNPEGTAGGGFSGGFGVAGDPNDEVTRVGTRALRLYMARLFVRQTFGLGGEVEKAADAANQLEGTQDSNRLTFTFGKLSVTDIFDNNSYSHDPRTQFMNWGLTTNPAWDYPADTRGYTWGATAEFAWEAWSWRAGGFLEPEESNGPHLDTDISRAHGLVSEFEHRHLWASHAGTVRLLAFWNQADMGRYRTALDTTGIPPDITVTRTAGTRKYGFGLNAEQEVSPTLGVFLRLGWNDGHTETWAFTEVDRTASFGLNFKGTQWRRPSDVVGWAVLVNGLSNDHRDYLEAGGTGFILGAEKLNYATENITEVFYAAQVAKPLTISLDFQTISHPGYNQDRGPVFVGGLRAHLSI